MNLFARTEHGGHPVSRVEGKIQIKWPTGVSEYDSARKAIMALVNNETSPSNSTYDPHMTFDRYFRLGRYRREDPPKLDLFDLFPMAPDELVVVRAPSLILPQKGEGLVVSPLGIDLAVRSKEVRKLFYAGFARRVLRYGYDPEDVLQDVYMGLIARNSGKCPFDPSKASFGHYVHMVCGCIISNYRRRYSRLERNEVFGVDDVEGESQDVAASDIAVSHPQDVSFLRANKELCVLLRAEALKIGVDPDMAVRAMSLVGDGLKNKEIAVALGASASMTSKLLQIIRSSAETWKSPTVVPLSD